MRPGRGALFGTRIPRSRYSLTRSVLPAPETAPSGNVVLRVGQERATSPETWQQTEHVVLEPEEAVAYAEAILAAVAEGGG